MKTQLSKKFGSYLPVGMGLTIVAMLLSASTNAQIVYTDVNPDVTINTNGGVYALDLNNDGITDFNITYSTALFVGQTNKYITITPLGTNKVGTTYIYPNALSLNTLIDSSSFTWSSSVNQSLISRIWFQVPRTGAWVWQNRGNWNGATDKYVPLQINVNSKKIYGWARLDAATNATSFTLKDYAYKSLPNQPILAGQTSCTTPTLTFTQNGSLSFCAGDSVTFTVNGTGLQYQWRKNGVNIAGATSNTYVAKTVGSYNCKVSNDCGSRFTKTKTVTDPCRFTNDVLNEELENFHKLKIAPNPISSSTIISFALDQSENISLKIFDLNGRLVKILASTNFTEGEHSIVWNVEELNEGAYLLLIQSAQFSRTEKLIVTK